MEELMTPLERIAEALERIAEVLERYVYAPEDAEPDSEPEPLKPRYLGDN